MYLTRESRNKPTTTTARAIPRFRGRSQPLPVFVAIMTSGALLVGLAEELVGEFAGILVDLVVMLRKTSGPRLFRVRTQFLQEAFDVEAVLQMLSLVENRLQELSLLIRIERSKVRGI